MSSFEWMELQTLTSDIETARTRLLDARKKRDHGRIRALEDEITQAEKRRLQLVAHISTSIASEEDTGGLRAGRSPTAGPSDSAAAEAETPPAAADAVAETEPAEDDAAVADEPAVAAAPLEETVEAEADADAEAEVEADADADADAEADAEAEQAEEETAPSRRSRGASAPAESEAAADREEEETPSNEPAEAPIELAAAVASAPAAKAASLEGGITMWDQLTPTDIDRAKRELGMRRAEMLARHAEELKALELEQGQIDTLEAAITSFLQKFNAAGGDAAVVKLDQERELRQQGNS